MWSALRGVEQRRLGLGALKLPALPGTALSLTVSPFRIVRLQVRRAQPALDRHPVDVTVLGLACALAARVPLGGARRARPAARGRPARPGPRAPTPPHVRA